MASTCRFCVLVIASVLLLGLGAYFAFLIAANGYVTSITESHGKCVPSACGNIHNIARPFRLANDPNQSNCANWDYYYYNKLFCHNNLTLLEVHSGNTLCRQSTMTISQSRVVDPGIHNNDCSSIPRYSLSIYNITYYTDFELASSTTPITFFECAKAVNSSAMSTYNYVKQGNIMASDMEDGCRIEWTTLMSKSFLHEKDRNFSYLDIHSALGYGFELQLRFLRTSNC